MKLFVETYNGGATYRVSLLHEDQPLAVPEPLCAFPGGSGAEILEAILGVFEVVASVNEHEAQQFDSVEAYQAWLDERAERRNVSPASTERLIAQHIVELRSLLPISFGGLRTGTYV